MPARAAFVLALALLATGCAGSTWIQRSRLTGWHAAQIGGTRVIGDLSAEEIQELADQLVRFDAVFARLVGWSPDADAAPLHVYLIHDRALAERFGIGGAVRGWELGTLDEAFFTVLISSGRDQDRSVLYHEYTHVLIEKHRRSPVPRWYHEGLASYFSTMYDRGGVVVVGAVPGTVAARVYGRGALPIDQLFTASRPGAGWAQVADFYATAWALSHYLLSTPAGRHQLTVFMQQLARGIPSDEAFRTAFGRSVDRVDKELAVHVAGLASGVAVESLIDVRDLPVSPPPAVVALSPGETAYDLGILALGMNGSDGHKSCVRGSNLALALLTLAHAEDPADARIEAALGEARAVYGDDDAAGAAAQAALARAPEDARVRRHAACVALLRAESEAESSAGRAPAFSEAEAQYRAAIALDPESADTWFGLGRALVQMGRRDDAFAAFQSARRYGWSESLDIAIARIQLERGERGQAAALLRPIAQNPGKSATKDEAAALLEKAAP